MNDPDEELRKAVALFRYGLIADVLRVPLGSREIRRVLHEKAQRTYVIPGTRRTRVAVETMRDWLSLYRTGGFEALYPKTRADRGQPRRLPPEVAERLVSLKTEQPALSVKALIKAARAHGVDHPLAPSTVHRLLSREGLLDARPGDPAATDRRRFAYRDAGELWMSDVMHGPKVRDARRRRKTYLIAFIDDATRVIERAQAFSGDSGELLALWEGGSASVLDRDTLEWQGFKAWGAGLEGLPFTAHPKVEADGTLWAFGYAFAPAPALVLYHIAADGTVVKAQALDPGPLGMVHDFVVTARHLVIVLPPLVLEPSRAEGMLLDAFVWRPALGSRVLVVDTDDFDDRRWVQLPAAFGFHHGNGWEDTTGTIRYDHCVAENATLMTGTMRDILRGKFTPGAPERYARFTLHPDGRVEMEDSGEAAEFPRIAPALTGRRNRYVYTLGVSSLGPGGWRLRRVVKRDLESEVSDSFDYGPGVVAEEHVFVPRRVPRSEDDGWLVGAFLDSTRGLTGVAVFDARRVGDGPVARAWLDYPMPLAFHGQFTLA